MKLSNHVFPLAAPCCWYATVETRASVSVSARAAGLRRAIHRFAEDPPPFVLLPFVSELKS